jgi:hypothetical protein
MSDSRRTARPAYENVPEFDVDAATAITTFQISSHSIAAPSELEYHGTNFSEFLFYTAVELVFHPQIFRRDHNPFVSVIVRLY